MTKLSIVIVNWNGVELLPGCLGPLADAGHEVIVVDNASEDGSQDLLRDGFDWARVVENDENLGFSVANNQGIARATGDYVLLLNSDTVPTASALAQVVDFLDRNPSVAVVGPTLTNADGSPQRSCGPGPNLWTEFAAKTLVHRLFPNLRMLAPAKDRRVDWVTGAALFIRRDLAVELGGLDEGMFMFYEDLDLCARVREAGHEIWFVATEPVIHLGGASRKKVESASVVHSYRSVDRYFSRHGPRWRRRVVRAMTMAEMVWRSLLWSAALLVPRRRRLAIDRLRAYGRVFRITLGRPG